MQLPNSFQQVTQAVKNAVSTGREELFPQKNKPVAFFEGLQARKPLKNDVFFKGCCS